MADIQVPRW